MQGVDRMSAIDWAALSPDGTTVAATGLAPDLDPTKGGLVAEWDARTGRMLGAPATVRGGYPIDLSFAPTGTTVAVTGENGASEVLDPASGTVESRFTVPQSNYSFGVAFSPDGSKLATTDFAGSIDLWDPTTGKRLGLPIPDPGQQVGQSVAWSPDGQTLALTDWGNTLRLFDAASRQEVGPPIPLETRSDPPPYPYPTYTPDGRDVVVADDAGQVWVVPATLQEQEAAACAVANRNLTRAEWNEFVPGMPYRQLCPNTAG
jgi:WD40 repeat protein